MIILDHTLTYDKTKASLNISSTQVLSVLHNHLKQKKGMYVWYFIVRWYMVNFKRFNSGASKYFIDIVIGSETMIYSYESEVKQNWLSVRFNKKKSNKKYRILLSTLSASCRQTSAFEKMIAKYFQQLEIYC